MNSIYTKTLSPARALLCKRYFNNFILTSVSLLLSTVFFQISPMAFAQSTDGGRPFPEFELDVGDPISTRTSSYYFTIPLFNLGGPLPVRSSLGYQSVADEPGVHVILPHMIRTQYGDICIRMFGEGREELTFTNTLPDNTGDWVAERYSIYRYGLQEQAGTNGWLYLMDPSDQSVYLFEKDYHPDDDEDQEAILRYHIDRHGNQVEYTRTPRYGAPNTTVISDGLGREIFIFVGGNGNLASISNGVRQYVLGYNANDHLTSFTDPTGATNLFEYTDNSDNIVAQVRPEGNRPYVQTYDESTYPFCRATSQSDAFSNVTTLVAEYLYDTNNLTEIRPDNSQVVYAYPTNNAGGGTPIGWQDAQSNTACFAADNFDRLTSLTDRAGSTTELAYHQATGFLTSFTNAEGQVFRRSFIRQTQTFTNPANAHVFSFDFHVISRVDYPDGTFVVHECDPHGNITGRLDRAGQRWTTTYSSQGLPLTTVNPAGGIVTCTYNADGTLASRADSDTGSTTYSYDEFKRVIAIDPPGPGQISLAYDAMDRLTSITNENGHATHHTYDRNGNLTSIIDAAGHTQQYVYDLMDRVSRSISRTGGTNTMAYNYRNQLDSSTNANGIVTAYVYNNRNWIDRVNRNGRITRFTQDDEGMTTCVTSPAGRAVHYQYDALGHLSQITVPGGANTRYARDGMGRVTNVIDELDRQTSCRYDLDGNLSQITRPGGISATYTRDAIGCLTNITDAAGHNWQFAYSPMGRLLSSTDPLSRTRTFTLDERGNIATVTYPDGATQTNSYDNAGTLIRQYFSDGTDLFFSHNAINLLTNTCHLSLTRDAEGRITASTFSNQTFGATYDLGGRITSATYGGTLTVTYDYNADNRLSQILDSLGHRISFTYDADGLLTALVRDNGIDATYTYDDQGRLSHLQDGSIIDLQYTYDAAGQLLSSSGTSPLDATTFLTATTTTYNVDAACQINADGFTYDDCGRITHLPDHTLSWDGASRLTAVNDVTLIYNGLHEIVSRTAHGTTTHFHHNHALGNAPIVAEQQNALFTRFYIFTPAGQLLYSIDPQETNAVRYYHHDHLGSTRALTDSAGTITDRYAYSPDGQLLGHSGSSDQPFTFVGTFGVRQEGALYQMRRRYYNPATGAFLSPEPIWPQIEDPRMLNPYQYALQRPTQLIDPSGLYPELTDAQINEINNNINEAEQHDAFSGMAYSLGGSQAQMEQHIEKAQLLQWEQQFRSIVGDGAPAYVAKLKQAVKTAKASGNADYIFDKLLPDLLQQARGQALNDKLLALNTYDPMGDHEVYAESWGMSAKGKVCRELELKLTTGGPSYEMEQRIANRRQAAWQLAFILHLMDQFLNTMTPGSVQHMMLNSLSGSE
ncbi:MAG: RHS repeat protein [Spartobacteria bacterium]|nr:RHS repeat protein [Spartobacteria bacterium]